MQRLLLSIIYVCLSHGEVESLLYLADSIDMEYGKAWRRLGRLEKRDCRLHVTRRGRGQPLLIHYDCEKLSGDIIVQLRSGWGITIPQETLYRGSYGDFRKSDEPQRHLHSS
jgi:hypothetical protein